MAGCPTELKPNGAHQLPPDGDAHLLALAEGVRRTAYWNLAPEYSGPVDHHQMMHLMIGKLPLVGYQDGELSVREPAAASFVLPPATAGARTVFPSRARPPAVRAPYRRTSDTPPGARSSLVRLPPSLREDPPGTTVLPG